MTVSLLLQVATSRLPAPRSRLFPDAEKLIEIAVRIGLTLVVAFLLQRLLFVVAGRIERLIAHHGHDSRQSTQRARTLGQILRNLITLMIAAGALVHVLEILGWDVKPLIAGAGIIGIAFGFGAQTLVRDVIAGVFILVENQYSVGDQIEINGNPATVEALTVRSTVLRDFYGYVHFVPNGEMKVVTNRSRDWNRITVDIVIPSGVDLDRALAVCREAVGAFNADPASAGRLLEPVELWGVEAITGQEATVRCALRAPPGTAALVAARELRHRLFQALAAARIQATAPPSQDLPPPPPAPPGGDPAAAGGMTAASEATPPAPEPAST